MIHTAKQLKDLVRNLAKKHSADAQLLMRNYMMERLLERISLSPYRDKIILKGGMLVAALVGLDARSTMDMDATVKNASVSVNEIDRMVSDIIAVPVDDGVIFRVKQISEIMEEADYPGIRVSLSTEFDGIVTPLKIDFSTGDVITPKEIRYRSKLMLEERTIEVLAYNLETVLSEKIETVIRRATANTRMRDFYDIHMLLELYSDSLSSEVLRKALLSTAAKRGSTSMLISARSVLDDLQQSDIMRKLWQAYQKKYSYAEGLSWDSVMISTRLLYALCTDDSLTPQPIVSAEEWDFEP